MVKAFIVSSCGICPHKTWAIQDPERRSFCNKADDHDESIDEFLYYGNPEWCPLPDVEYKDGE